MPCKTTVTSLKTTPWKWPWVLLNVSIYAFCIPWMASAIFHRYYIEKDYDSTLPGLDDTDARKFFMGAHMGCGAICLFLYPLQFTWTVRRRWPKFHRWTGRVAVCSALLCSLFGTVFIFLKGFILVGGLNMGLAFFTSGLVFAFCAVMTAKNARIRDFQRHRHWAIRSFSQVLAPPLYRYFYLVMGGLGALPDTEDSNGELACNEEDVCDVFLRAFDALHAWTYWIFPLLCAELVVYLLKKQDTSSKVVKIDNSNVSEPDEATNTGDDQMVNEEEVQNDLEECHKDLAKPTTSSLPSVNYMHLNLLGLVGGISYFIMTAFIYVTSALGINNVST